MSLKTAITKAAEGLAVIIKQLSYQDRLRFAQAIIVFLAGTIITLEDME